jgi:hypothetical protein
MSEEEYYITFIKRKSLTKNYVLEYRCFLFNSSDTVEFTSESTGHEWLEHGTPNYSQVGTFLTHKWSI